MTKSRDARRFEQIMKTLNSERRDQVFKAAIAAMIDIRSQGDALSDVFRLIDVIAALMARGSRGWESKPAVIRPEDFDAIGEMIGQLIAISERICVSEWPAVQ